MVIQTNIFIRSNFLVVREHGVDKIQIRINGLRLERQPVVERHFFKEKSKLLKLSFGSTIFLRFPNLV